MSGTVLRYLFPSRLVRCNHCGHVGFRQAGRSRSGELRYCRCSRCGNTFTLPAVAMEVVDESGHIRIQPLRTYDPRTRI
jgi:hypothetical protein